MLCACVWCYLSTHVICMTLCRGRIATCLLFGASLNEPRIHEVQEAVLYVYIYIFVCMFVG